MVTSYHRNYVKELGICNVIEAYVQTVTVEKTLEGLSLDGRRRIKDIMDERDGAVAMETGSIEKLK